MCDAFDGLDFSIESFDVSQIMEPFDMLKRREGIETYILG